jgi:hypothetical protein
MYEHERVLKQIGRISATYQTLSSTSLEIWRSYILRCLYKGGISGLLVSQGKVIVEFVLWPFSELVGRCVYNFFPPGATQPIVGVYITALFRALASSRTRLLDHTQRRATVGRTPLNE